MSGHLKLYFEEVFEGKKAGESSSYPDDSSMFVSSIQHGEANVRTTAHAYFLFEMSPNPLFECFPITRLSSDDFGVGVGAS